MRFSQLYAPTLKEAPADADLISIKLLVRGGFVRKVAAGIYSFLPLGLRVLKKIEDIVRQEMNAIGSQEILMPIIQPAELWHETGRWDDYGPEMMRMQDRHERFFTLGPTHEEIITDLMRNELNSYKQLPVSLYQIAMKYRDEIRPRFGLMRSREFLMKDAYSFHDSWPSLDETYKQFYGAYSKILQRIGLEFLVVEADSGAIGGNESHEFNVLADYGESTLLYCDCGYAASDEKAEYLLREEPQERPTDELQLVPTPNSRTVDEVSAFLEVTSKDIVKSLIFKGRLGYYMALIRGNEELNESKLKAALQDQTLVMATPQEVLDLLGVPIGFVGPIGLPKEVTIIADHTIKGLKNAVCGALKEGYHYSGVLPGRDFKINSWHDLKMVTEGDPCPKCGTPMKSAKGIEVGHIFKLGTKYSEKMNGYVTDDKGNSIHYIMGCYGWGVSRTISAVVEQLHDENGIIWPLAVAPFDIIITAVNIKDKVVSEKSVQLYELLRKEGFDVLLDDREISPGMKFKDADLIGIPLRITLGKKLAQGIVEVKLRTEKKPLEVSIDEGFDSLLEEIKKELSNYRPVSKMEAK
ncbi:proline--tRNA ligase [Mesotoga prima]|uniref:proline--tRNA ligase n=3 Tax=Mesotoga prima TaxID=1184387 RepID=UPI002D08C06C|nr:proline--tRNA ligase [Mesotoga prima]MCP5461542.1 proline--tRNA ligase [Thermotogota bacterium]HNS76265.1 proline--tRNA ligase [Mesotoga prima]HUM22518.1 proline--tRNA ligase [Mesotoga prima]